jgi:hypothetical protein
MKRNRPVYLVVIITSLSSVFFVFNGFAQIKSNSSSESDAGIQLNISSKDSYLLGETVFFDFEVKNNSSADIRVKGLDLDSRYITLYISFEGKTYKQYKHSRIKDQKGGLFKAGQIKKSRSGVLWNLSPVETSANWKEKAETEILTYYAFPQPGIYFVKAVLQIPSNENPIKIESKPIQIIINEPTGEDLNVWNLIKDRSDIGYFIQEGEPRAYKEDEKQKLIQEVEKIIKDYPNSLLTNQIKQSLEKFRLNEAKINESKQKNQTNQTKPQ